MYYPETALPVLFFFGALIGFLCGVCVGLALADQEAKEDRQWMEHKRMEHKRMEGKHG